MNGSTYEDRLEKHWKLCKEYFYRKKEQYRLHGWRISLNSAKTSLGTCYYGEKKICVSKHFLRGPTCNEKKIKDTVLHEIAHALAGPDAGHGKKWKEVAKSIGCSAKTCASMDLPDAKYVLFCKNKCFQTTYYRKPKLDRKICAKCFATPILKNLK